VLLVPTNAASFKTSQVPTTEVASAQLRAIETGRDLAQAAPTGYGALIDSHGRVKARTTLGRREVLHGVMHERTGQTLYSRTGDGPVVLLALLGLVLSAWRSRRPSRTSPSP
jgi:apolipoprotein N-acyltransferase